VENYDLAIYPREMSNWWGRPDISPRIEIGVRVSLSTD